jgi:hypothetical protein
MPKPQWGLPATRVVSPHKHKDCINFPADKKVKTCFCPVRFDMVEANGSACYKGRSRCCGS